ncbi:MAG: UDP-N-acetylmuramate:L-alanyl-gamma-D-glutamyl-meso-diaminopimelate ligase [Pseudomonadota bacterium]|nr:UDP-N-acetylmuramate:L-alanyl-gamma-D-glutamyl-meso-diaminopimelate ligase [Pseudomonadota bacterium]
MNIHILGIGGTFMAGIARLAQQLGHKVSGSDKTKIYPPMSGQIERLEIPISFGYSKNSIPENSDLIIVGNSLSRGQPVVEMLLNENINFTSGPAWLAEHVLRDRKRIVVSGTHGKTTVSSLITWMLEKNGHRPGFLIGGIPGNFPYSAELGKGDFFVIEGDEYDSAFFDKRSKFIHYRPDILVINNLEFDHADIFDNLSQITTQFHHMIRTMSSNAKIVRPHISRSIDKLMEKGCWSSVKNFGRRSNANLQYSLSDSSDRSITFFINEKKVKSAQIGLGEHNADNLAAAILACECAGVPAQKAIKGIENFCNAKRRMEFKGEIGGVSIYDDFAHHPTAIRASVNALKKAIGKNRRLIAIIEPRSNSMRMGLHKSKLNYAIRNADSVGFYCENELSWSIEKSIDRKKLIGEWNNASEIAKFLTENSRNGDCILVMSNGSAGSLHDLLLAELKGKKK